MAYFDNSILAKVLLRADEMWQDGIHSADFVSNVDVVKAIASEQTAVIKELSEGKDRDVDVTWIKPVSTTVADETDDCSIGGDDLTSGVSSYSLSYAKTAGFSIPEKKFRSNAFDLVDAVTIGLLSSAKALEEDFAQHVVGQLESYKGTNQLDGFQGTVNGGTGDTDIATADWDENLFAYFVQAAVLNSMNNPYLLTGSSFFQETWNAMMDEANADGKGTARKFNSLRKYTDLFNIDLYHATNGSSELKSYLVNRGALALAFKAYYGPEPTVYFDQQRFSIESRNIPGLRFDVYYTNACSTNEMSHSWSLHMKGDVLLNPTISTDLTGVLAFNKTA